MKEELRLIARVLNQGKQSGTTTTIEVGSLDWVKAIRALEYLESIAFKKEDK